MRVTLIALAVLIGLAQWAQGCDRAEPIVIIKAQCKVPASPGVVEPAKALASQLFLRIGVELRWERPRTPLSNAGCVQKAIVIEMLICSGPWSGQRRFSSEALGYAMPYASSGIRIYMFYDRILKICREPNNLIISVLSYAFAHEIAHVLEGECRHSREGVMKAKWQSADFSQMAVRQLAFADNDVVLIHAGLARRLTPLSTDLAIAANEMP